MNGWPSAGLRFSCTQCGDCCTGEPGHVWVDPAELRRIASFLGVSEVDARRRYARRVDGRTSLVERENGDCVFLTKERRCAINPVKPRQCLTFPFWPRITASPEAWRDTAARCPGIGRGRTFTPEEIARIQSSRTPREEIARIFSREPA